MDLEMKHTFQPVGQGLFYNGVVTFPNRRSYRWVYDCGTHSEKALVQREVARVVPEGRLDLLILSHFDADHVNGVADLVTAVGANTLMLPYMPLWNRLLLAFDQGLDPTDPITIFYINPAAYLASLEGEAPQRVIFVPRSDGGEPRPRGDDEPLDAPVGEDSERATDEFETVSTREAQRMADDFNAMAEAAQGIDLKMLRRGGSIKVRGLWEFVPYNDPKAAPSNKPAFEKAVSAKATDLLAAPGSDKAAKIIHDLKVAYDRYIGQRNRNRGSLFVYSGPIHDWPQRKFHAWRWAASSEAVLYEIFGHLGKKCGIMLTGDGTLENDNDFNHFTRWFQLGRMSRIAVLQVMHHGAENNTRPGRAVQIDPHIAVFSSDPSRKRPGHPHKKVVKDFSAYNPCLADQHAGVTVITRFTT